jgi:hypothetical protein
LHQFEGPFLYDKQSVDCGYCVILLVDRLLQVVKHLLKCRGILLGPQGLQQVQLLRELAPVLVRHACQVLVLAQDQKSGWRFGKDHCSPDPVAICLERLFSEGLAVFQGVDANV